MEWTKIEWADHSWSPWIGCSHVHTGCAHCYAEEDFDKRKGRVVWGPSGTRSRTSLAYWKKPLKWEREAQAACEAAGDQTGYPPRPRVFPSLCDPFEWWRWAIVDHQGRRLWRSRDGDGHTEAERAGGSYASMRPLTMDDLRSDLFELIGQTPHVDWLLLTKRPENVREMWPRDADGRLCGFANVWLLYSASDQATFERGWLELMACANLVRVVGLSLEPLLAPIDLSAAEFSPSIDHWVIVGGESGSAARPCNVAWVRYVVYQCAALEVPCFVKQLGANAVGLGRQLLHKKGADPDEWPDDLRVRELP